MLLAIWDRSCQRRSWNISGPPSSANETLNTKAADPDWQIVGGDPASCNRCNRTAAPTLVLGPAFGRRSLALNALALSPQFAIISVGANNRSANPSDDTLTRLRDSGAAIYRTDEHGTIHLTTDGEQVWIETEK